MLTEHDLEDADLQGVRVLVLPNVACLSDRAAEVVRRFVTARRRAGRHVRDVPLRRGLPASATTSPSPTCSGRIRRHRRRCSSGPRSSHLTLDADHPIVERPGDPVAAEHGLAATRATRPRGARSP